MFVLTFQTQQQQFRYEYADESALDRFVQYLVFCVGVTNVRVRDSFGNPWFGREELA